MLEIETVIKSLDRYKDFTLLVNPRPFCELFKDRDFNVVQVHSTQIIETDFIQDIVGFCGQFEWVDNVLKPLDGDSYNKDVAVIGYEFFSNIDAGIISGIDILVGDAW